MGHEHASQDRPTTRKLQSCGSEPLRRAGTIIGIICIAAAVLAFVSGAFRMVLAVARANVGLYEALLLGILGLVIVLTSRRW